MKVRAGDVLNGKYEVERQLAKGGMGSIWIARDRKLCRRVAVKFIEISPKNAGDAAAIQARFEREALAVARLNTAHAVHIYDHGLDAQTPYIVMEYLEGEDLRQALAREGRLSLTFAADIMNQAARGLRAAHEADIVHRDLKPANIFLAEVDHQRMVKILDFGIAKLLDHRAVTVDGEVFGSAKYMSPEQVAGAKDLDLRSDLWSMGVILYRAITGKDPFSGDVVEVMRLIRRGKFRPATVTTPDLAPAVDAFFERALAFDRQRRFLSALEMAEAFAEVAEKEATTTIRIITPSRRSGELVATATVRDSVPPDFDEPNVAKGDKASAAPVDHETLSATASEGASTQRRRSRAGMAALAAIALTAAGVALRPRLAPASGDVRPLTATESSIESSPALAAPAVEPQPAETAAPTEQPDLDAVEIAAPADSEVVPAPPSSGALPPESDAERSPRAPASAAASARTAASAHAGATRGADVSVPKNPY